MGKILGIKNMVCFRCILAVEEILLSENIDATVHRLGEIELNKSYKPESLVGLKEKLYEIGFEVLDSTETKVVEQIKTLVIKFVRENREGLVLSEHLSENLNQAYSQLSRLFSSVEGLTIERFMIIQRIERIKELVAYGELSVKEIAYEMNFSSPSYLSNLFKKETGMSLSQFKGNLHQSRKFLDQV